MYKRTLQAFVVLTLLYSMFVVGGNQNIVAEETVNESEVVSVEVKENIELVMLADNQNDISLELYENPWEGYDTTMTQEEIDEEIMYGDMELISQLCQAEAGNQGLIGMRYVVDVVLNRVDSDKFPNTVEDVIYQMNPTQFSTMVDGAFERAGYNMSDEAFEAVELEWFGDRLDSGILYFSSTDEPVNGHNAWKYGDHWFSY